MRPTVAHSGKLLKIEVSPRQVDIDNFFHVVTVLKEHFQNVHVFSRPIQGAPWNWQVESVMHFLPNQQCTL